MQRSMQIGEGVHFVKVRSRLKVRGILALCKHQGGWESDLGEGLQWGGGKRVRGRELRRQVAEDS